MGGILYAQWRGLAGSVRLLFSFLALPLIVLVCSHYAAVSWAGPDTVMRLCGAMLALLGGETVFFLTVDELRGGILDLMFLSPLSPCEVLVGKLSLPVGLGFTVALGVLLLNNLLAQFWTFGIWAVSPLHVLLLLIASTVSASVELLSLLVLRKREDKLHFLLLAAELLGIFGLDALLSMRLWLSAAAVAVLLLGTPLAMSVWLLRHPARLTVWRGRGLALPGLFPARKISVLGAFARKNLSILRMYRHAWLHLLVGLLCPLLPLAFSQLWTAWGLETGDAVFFLASAFPAVCHFYLIYCASLWENRSRAGEGLRAAFGDRPLFWLEKPLISGGIAAAGTLLVLTIARLAGAAIAPVAVAWSIIQVLASAALCGALFGRTASERGERVARAMIALLCAAGQALIVLTC